MEVIVVEMKLLSSTVKFVNALKLQRQQHKPMMDQIATYHIGLAITSVMMKTIILNADMMVAIVVERMST